ncbi:Methionine import ATP-binding protein MetN [Apilactobacillus kunkeei]|uniref:methionine ABC transporter ATP-binding protein n=1 Tax=Apilactobacillus kunkeei TaxID=148814 RepID=UPI00110CBF08|nr:methionine ABC transporter ATP-binding protein [Apilactobacillus kunkeei]TMS99708.1 methionine ABC transporter ATP-binding protein [Apilactobacillus kunkeei]CAI2688574.1 Methionine import ATP-binding protein MetN [Apilactobacillus kunkeei]CAI2689520.1 Methionine import ATP-binding protein MetN [Apilactobacillus kunkeei]
MAQISLEHIDVTFKQKHQVSKAVQDVTLQIEKGDAYGIVGYSGAGKSTLVRVINQLQKPSAGKVIIDNKDIDKFSHAQIRQLRKNIGFIFQHFNLMNARTIEDNILYPMVGTKTSNEERKQRVQRLINLVGLNGKEKFYPAQLSGGQKQRVAIARALANNPQILISDEATSALDPKTTQAILQLLKKINKELGVTIVLITHEMDVVKSLCNKVAVMDTGKVVEKGSILEVFSNPKTQLTKDFIDTTNNVKEAVDTLSAQEHFVELSRNQQLFRLHYIGASAETPIIVDLYQKFGAVSNIVYGNIEFISNVPLGNLIIEIDAEESTIKEIKEYLASQDVHLTNINLDQEKIRNSKEG